jgi:hypothetical protein
VTPGNLSAVPFYMNGQFIAEEVEFVGRGIELSMSKPGKSNINPYRNSRKIVMTV